MNFLVGQGPEVKVSQFRQLAPVLVFGFDHLCRGVHPVGFANQENYVAPRLMESKKPYFGGAKLESFLIRLHQQMGGIRHRFFDSSKTASAVESKNLCRIPPDLPNFHLWSSPALVDCVEIVLSQILISGLNKVEWCFVSLRL